MNLQMTIIKFSYSYHCPKKIKSIHISIFAVFVGIPGAYPRGEVFGACAPLEPNAQRKSLRELSMLDNSRRQSLFNNLC